MADVTLDRPRSGDGLGPATAAREATAPTDPRAIRVAVGPATSVGDEPTIVVSPPAVPLAPRTSSAAGSGLLGGLAPLEPRADAGNGAGDGEGDGLAILDAGPAGGPTVIVDGEPVPVRLARGDRQRAILIIGQGRAAVRHRVVLTDEPVQGPDGVTRREVVVDGWRLEIAIESERRAALRERARRGREQTAHGGPTEVKAIIPGLVVSVSVVPGDAVTAGQQILVVEAMKMQNELRAPRDGTIAKVGVAPGVNIEVGDLLLVIE
jgi:biotin carboxyl carrier protein